MKNMIGKCLFCGSKEVVMSYQCRELCKECSTFTRSLVKTDIHILQSKYDSLRDRYVKHLRACHKIKEENIL